MAGSVEKVGVPAEEVEEGNEGYDHYCPWCASPSTQEAVYEHQPCGHIDSASNWRGRSAIFCPKCEKQLKNTLRLLEIGSVNVCSSCDRTFEQTTPTKKQAARE